MEIKELNELLQEFQRIPKPKISRTLMEISGYPHFENVSSNILLFYLNPKNEHDLNDLVLKSLYEVIKEAISKKKDSYLSKLDFNKYIYNENVVVEKEIMTDKGNRLDLLITSKEYAIGIENKIYHYLHNDLEDYKSTIDKQNKNISIGIVLSLSKLNSKLDIEKIKISNFINITHNELHEKIKTNLGNYANATNLIYTTYLLDYMKSIQNLSPKLMENSEINSFYKKNSESLIDLKKGFEVYVNQTLDKANKLSDHFKYENPPLKASKMWVYDEAGEGYFLRSFVLEYRKDKHPNINIEACIDLKEWNIIIRGQNNSSKELLKSFIPNVKNLKVEGERFSFSKFENDVELTEVIDSLDSLITQFEKIYFRES